MATHTEPSFITPIADTFVAAALRSLGLGIQSFWVI